MRPSFCDRVFVYGTLKQGGIYHSLIAPHLLEVQEGWVPGVLVDLGTYPGWVPGPGRVWGEVVRVAPVVEALAKLDELEDYHGPGRPENLYERVLVKVETATAPVEAWAYRYLGPTEGRPAVPGGRWPVG
ncbi:gamma-glutamylcyclotransferase family protein [Deferrisoma camini]|uniref:gamma-glutamylcyclotransferase family protein n=1 Tax=Deferrisoma camini TaxID=1035120 RepID=UPI00046CC06A|nr:gamma-glutamylcyclotransferase family protein [Deferrisoma camini]